MKIISKNYINNNGELEEYEIYVGENSKDNFIIISNANQNDVWFHLDKFSSPHVILHFIKRKYKDLNKIPKIMVNEALTECKNQSRFRNINKKIGFIYTFVKNIKKTKEIGTVITKNEKYIMF